jgi:hypothetical protein
MSLIINQSDNSQIPGQPEYGKSWKPQFNHGCCPDCKEPEKPICTTKVQAFTRYSQDPSLVTTVVNSGDCPCQNEAPATGCQEAPETIDCSSISA